MPVCYVFGFSGLNMCGSFAFVVRYDMMFYALNRCLLPHFLIEVPICVGPTSFCFPRRGFEWGLPHPLFEVQIRVGSFPFLFRGADL